jgi:hypothetical protein
MAIQKRQPETSKAVNTADVDAALGLNEPQSTAQPQVQTQTHQSDKVGAVTVQAFTGAIRADVTGAKAEIAKVRQAAESELMNYAKQEIALYQGFKEALPAAMAGFLSSAAWEPAVLTFDVSAEPVHQLTAGV